MKDRLTIDDLIERPQPTAPTCEISYCIGLDLGQAQDYSALGIVETKAVAVAARATPDDLDLTDDDMTKGPKIVDFRLTTHGAAAHRTHQLRYLHRYPLRTGYPEIVESVAELVSQAPLTSPGTTLLVDKTGVGAPVTDMLRAKRLPVRLRAVTITGGTSTTQDGINLHVPKRDLVSAVLVLLQNGDLQIAADLPLAETLRTELKGFRVKISAGGHDSYAAGDDWRSAPHDDLVLAVALACWQAAKPPLRIGMW